MLVAGNAISLSCFSVVKCLVSFLNFCIWRFSFVIIGFLKLLFVPEWVQASPRSQAETHTAFSCGGRGSETLRRIDFAVVTLGLYTFFVFFLKYF